MVHELVHFLQHNTIEEDNAYVPFDGQNYPGYLGQRVELEAHAVQLRYIMEYDARRFSRLSVDDGRDFVTEIMREIEFGASLDKIHTCLRICKSADVI